VNINENVAVAPDAGGDGRGAATQQGGVYQPERKPRNLRA
jgi:hypothetical protein